MAKSTERHARETMAKAGAIMDVSRETVRKVRLVSQYFIDGEEVMMSGEYTATELYNLAKGDTRAALYVKIPRYLKEKLRAAAQERGETINECITDILTQIFG